MLCLPEDKNLMARCFPIKTKTNKQKANHNNNKKIHQLYWLVSIIGWYTIKLAKENCCWGQFPIDIAVFGMGTPSIHRCFKGFMVISSIKDKVISQNFQFIFPNHFKASTFLAICLQWQQLSIWSEVKTPVLSDSLSKGCRSHVRNPFHCHLSSLFASPSDCSLSFTVFLEV